MKRRVERLLLRAPVALRQSLHSLVRPSGIYYLTPRANWSIDWDGRYITRTVSRQYGVRARLTFTARGLRDQLLHYGSLGGFVGSLHQDWNARNRVVMTIFHGDRTPDEPELMAQVDALLDHTHVPERIITACSIMEQRLHAWGVPSAKIVRIPLGVDVNLFSPAAPNQRRSLRQRLGIPEDAICIGSFQKDGVGWGAGEMPKLIKGPDLFLKVVAQLRARYPLFVLLTGPARGYVTAGLDAMGVPYRHDMLDNFLDIVDYYRCLDLYLVTSREEGGPKAVLECLATGVPLVSTRVGMAPDVIDSGVNGLLADVEDVPALVAAAQQMLDDAALRKQCVQNGLQTVQSYDWPAIARRYWEQVYAPLMADSSRNGGQR